MLALHDENLIFQYYRYLTFVIWKEMATHSSTSAQKIPWMEEPVVYSPWGRKESDTTERLHFHFKYGIGFHFVHSVFLSKLFLIHAYQFLMNLLGRL